MGEDVLLEPRQDDDGELEPLRQVDRHERDAGAAADLVGLGDEGGPVEDDLSDELYDQAIAIVSEMKTVSISMLQRKMRIGYNRSARMIERMERDGIVGHADGAKPREVLIRKLGEMPGA